MGFSLGTQWVILTKEEVIKFESGERLLFSDAMGEVRLLKEWNELPNEDEGGCGDCKADYRDDFIMYLTDLYCYINFNKWKDYEAEFYFDQTEEELPDGSKLYILAEMS